MVTQTNDCQIRVSEHEFKTLKERIQSLEADKNKYEEALRFYANETRYFTNTEKGEWKDPVLATDRGKRAREALGESE
jgi:hypothetical protein